MGIFSNIISGIGTAYNIFSGERANKINQQNYQETSEWQKSENEITRAREDNAIQRRMADLKASGINPIIAGESGAGVSSGGITPVQQYQKDETSGQMIANLVSQKVERDNLKAQTEVAKAQAENVKAQTAKIEEETKGYEGSRQNVSADTALKELRKQMDEYDFNLSQKTNTKTNASGIVADVANAINAVSGAFERDNIVKDGIDHAKNGIQEIIDITDTFASVPAERWEEIKDEVKRELPKMIKNIPQRFKDEWYQVCKKANNPIAWGVRQTDDYKEWLESKESSTSTNIRGNRED